jgi:hypothetical protein
MFLIIEGLSTIERDDGQVYLPFSILAVFLLAVL